MTEPRVTVQDDRRLQAVRRLLAITHPRFTDVTIERLVQRTAVEHDWLSGTDLHARVVHHEAHRLLSYVDGGHV